MMPILTKMLPKRRCLRHWLVLFLRRLRYRISVRQRLPAPLPATLHSRAACRRLLVSSRTALLGTNNQGDLVVG